MEAVLYSPPILFFFVLLLMLIFSKWLSRYSVKGKTGKHSLEPYACGQRDVENYVNPDYSQYFSYAFIFTVAHILILVVATIPKQFSILPVIYIISGLLALLIAFKR